MPRRKKTWMLLRSGFGNFIVVERRWYDSVSMGKQRGRWSWRIVAESDDHGAMQAMAGLTGRYVRLDVNHTTEEGNKC